MSALCLLQRVLIAVVFCWGQSFVYANNDCTPVPYTTYKVCTESNGKVAAEAEFEVYRVDKKGQRVSVGGFSGEFGGIKFSPDGKLTATYLLDGGVIIVFNRTEYYLNLKEGYADFKKLSDYEMEYFLSIENDGVARYALKNHNEQGEQLNCPRLLHPISKKEVFPNTYRDGKNEYCIKLFNIIK